MSYSPAENQAEENSSSAEVKHVREELSSILQQDIDVLIFGESHADTAARDVLIYNIDLLAKINKQRPVTVLMEHLPYENFKLGLKWGAPLQHMNILDEVKKSLGDKKMTDNLRLAIERSTSFYSVNTPEYIALGEACIANGINFGGAETEVTNNSSIFGCSALERVDKGDQAFKDSVMNALKANNSENKPLVILLGGLLHIVGVKNMLAQENINAFSWAILSKNNTPAEIEEKHVNADISCETIHMGMGFLEHLEEQYSNITIDLINAIDIEVEREYSSAQAKQNLETNAALNQRSLFSKNRAPEVSVNPTLDEKPKSTSGP